MDNDFFSAPSWAKVALFRLAERHGHHWAVALVADELSKTGLEWPHGYAEVTGEAACDRAAAKIGTTPQIDAMRVVMAHPCGPCGGLLPSVSHRTTTGRSGWEIAGGVLTIRIYRPDAMVIQATVTEHGHRWAVTTDIDDRPVSCCDRHASELRDHLRTIGRSDADLDRLVEYLRNQEARGKVRAERAERAERLLAIDPLRNPAAFDAAWF